MNRDSEARLLAFCVEQRSRFDAVGWLEFNAVARTELAAVAHYLAGVSWYGHQPHLRELAAQLSPDSFSALVSGVGFDPSRFGGLLKAHLRHAGQSVAA